MSRPKQRKGGRVTPKGTGSTKGARPVGSSSPDLPTPEIPDLSGLLDPEDFLPDLVPLDADAADERQLDLAIRAALGTGDPADLLALASMIAEQIAEHERVRASTPGSEIEDEVTWAELLEITREDPYLEPTALAYALMPFAPREWADEAERIVALRHGLHVPEWVRRIGEVEIAGVWEQSNSGGDGDDVLVGVRWPTGEETTVVAYVDRDLGGVVKDALVARLPLDLVLEHFRTDAVDGVSLRELDPAVARERVEAAVQRWDPSMPVESHDWPDLRPMVLWLVSKLPAGDA